MRWARLEAAHQEQVPRLNLLDSGWSNGVFERYVY